MPRFPEEKLLVSKRLQLGQADWEHGPPVAHSCAPPPVPLPFPPEPVPPEPVPPVPVTQLEPEQT